MQDEKKIMDDLFYFTRVGNTCQQSERMLYMVVASNIIKH